MFKSFVLLLCLSLAVALPVTRETDDSSKGVTRSIGSRSETVVHAGYKPSLDDDDVVYLVRRGKKKKKTQTPAASASGSGGASGSGSGSHQNPPTTHPHPPPNPNPAHANAVHPHGTPQHPQGTPQHPQGTPQHPQPQGTHPTTPATAATAARPPPMSWANMARLAANAKQAARRVIRTPSPPPFANTPATQHGAIMNRVNNRRERDGQASVASGNVAHAFRHNNVDYHLLRNDGRGGLDHINNRHGAEFDAKGWDNRGHVIERAIRTGNVVASQNGRPIYEFQHNGGTHHLAVTTGADGYIVGANVSDPAQVAYYQNRARQAASGSGTQ